MTYEAAVPRSDGTAAMIVLAMVITPCRRHRGVSISTLSAKKAAPEADPPEFGPR